MLNRIIRPLLAGTLGVALLGGCTSTPPPAKTGFLSDYDNLKMVERNSYRYTADDITLREYRSFLVDPVGVDFHAEAAGANVPAVEQKALAQYARDQLIAELKAGYYVIAMGPARGTARIRMQLTDVIASGDMQLRGAAIEAEVVDSTTGKQVSALVESRSNDWGNAREVIDAWVKRYRQRLDNAFGPRPTPTGALPAQSGFLSTYTNLQPQGPSSLGYVNPDNRLGRYDKFMIEPVEVFFHEQETTVSQSNEQRLKQIMRDSLVNALEDRYQVVTTPAFDVARVRVALTDVQRSAPILNALPRLKIADFGLGGMSMEAEVLDSVSGVQIGALIESSLGRNLDWNPSEWDDAEGAMRDWAQRFRRSVDDAHTRAGGVQP